MAATEIDHWIGKMLFVPPIIKLCQLTRQTQHAVSRLFWLIAALDGLHRANTLVGSILFGVLSVVMVFSASIRADRPTRSVLWFRMLALAFLILDLLTGAVTGQWAGLESWMLVLVAEYAATIQTIPPRESEHNSPQSSRLTEPRKLRRRSRP